MKISKNFRLRSVSMAVIKKQFCVIVPWEGVVKTHLNATAYSCNGFCRWQWYLVMEHFPVVGNDKMYKMEFIVEK